VVRIGRPGLLVQQGERGREHRVTQGGNPPVLDRRRTSRSELSVSMTARRVGYDSEEAFSGAFKRERGASPSHWRATIRRNRRPLSSI
jgi:hypothetical protein